MRNFGIDNALRNVVIVINMWGEVGPGVGKNREAKLKESIFKSVIDGGARMARHENTLPPAKKIIRLILGDHPLPLRIQEELVEGLDRVIDKRMGSIQLQDALLNYTNRNDSKSSAVYLSQSDASVESKRFGNLTKSVGKVNVLLERVALKQK